MVFGLWRARTQGRCWVYRISAHPTTPRQMFFPTVFSHRDSDSHQSYRGQNARNTAWLSREAEVFHCLDSQKPDLSAFFQHHAKELPLMGKARVLPLPSYTSRAGICTVAGSSSCSKCIQTKLINQLLM